MKHSRRRSNDRHLFEDPSVTITDLVIQRSGKRVGKEYLFLCPSHNDTRPSARWNPEKLVWHCFACEAGGGVLDLAERLDLPVRRRQPLGVTADHFRDERTRREHAAAKREGVLDEWRAIQNRRDEITALLLDAPTLRDYYMDELAELASHETALIAEFEALTMEAKGITV